MNTVSTSIVVKNAYSETITFEQTKLSDRRVDLSVTMKSCGGVSTQTVEILRQKHAENANTTLTKMHRV